MEGVDPVLGPVLETKLKVGTESNCIIISCTRAACTIYLVVNVFMMNVCIVVYRRVSSCVSQSVVSESTQSPELVEICPLCFKNLNNVNL